METHEELILKYLLKEANADEQERLDLWLKANKKNATILFEIEQLWSKKEELKFSHEVHLNKAFGTLLMKIGSDKTIKRRSLLKTWIRIAAAIVVFVSISANLLQIKTIGESDGMNTVEVPRGQSISMTLSDGTKVWLNAESRLTYPGTFSLFGRKVLLEGEGYFEVEHNRLAPFNVEMTQLSIKVLGTKFNARGYLAEEKTSVTLAEGAVEITSVDRSTSITLSPNEQANYDAKNGLTKRKLQNTESHTMWKSGEIFFDEQPLGVIAQQLGLRFNTEIHVEDSSLATEQFTCRTGKNTSLIEVLTLLKQTKRVDYTISNNKINLIKTKPMK